MRPVVLAHAEDYARLAQPNEYTGSPLYDVIPEHEAAVVAVIVTVVGTWWLRHRAKRGKPRASAWVAGYRRLTLRHRLLAWMLALSAAIHYGLVLGHEPSAYSLGYGALAAGLTWCLVSLVRGGAWRRRTRLVLLASVVGYFASTVAGSAPDQVGMATKLLELTALIIAMTPAEERRRRQLLANAGVIGLFVLTAAGAWAGAFSSGGGHHLGEVPAPGVLIPAGEDREPTAAEQRRADEFHRATEAALDKYRDPEVAAADGYDVAGMWGKDFHASNAAYEADGHIFDPARPESLVYAVDDGEPVLLGAMFTMPEMGEAGPAVGGPLTVWHAHDHICLGLPGIISGLQSPFGTCPVGSVTIPETNEMIHVWTLPGVPEAFGDLDQAWLNDYLERN